MEERRKLDKILKIGIIILAIIVLFTIIALNIRYEVTITRYAEHTEIKNMEIGKLLLSFLIAIIVISIINKINQLNIHRNIKIAIMILSIIIYASFQVVWIQYCNIQPGADAGMVLESAKRIFNNIGISETMIRYLSYYRQNIGLVILFEKIMWLFNSDNCNLLRFVNVLSNVWTVLGLYAIYKMIVNKENRRNSLLFFLLMLGFLPISLLVTWTYGDFIGLSFAIWSVTFMIKYIKIKKVHYFIVSSVLMCFAIIVRSNSLIFIIAMTIYLLLTIGELQTRKEKIIRLICVGIFIIVTIFPNKILISNFSKKYQLLDGKEKSVILYLYMGMSEGEAANGWYNNEMNDINGRRQYAEKEDDRIDKEIMEKFKQRTKFLLKHPIYTLRFYKDKILSMWAEPTMASEGYNVRGNVDPNDNKLFVLLMDGNNFEVLKLSQKIIDGIIYVGAFLYIILKRKNMSNEILLLVLVFLGGFSFHMIWEAKSRYIIPYVVILIPIAVMGIDEFIKYLTNQRKQILLKKGEAKNGGNRY